MDAGRLKGLLVLDDERTDIARALENYEDIDQWCFVPTGDFRDRIFFIWITKDRTICGTRCRPDYSDPIEPWEWHAVLPEKFLRAMLDLCPPEEVAAALARHITK